MYLCSSMTVGDHPGKMTLAGVLATERAGYRTLDSTIYRKELACRATARLCETLCGDCGSCSTAEGRQARTEA